MPDHSFPSENNLPSQSPFDGIRKIDEQGHEYWSARDLMPLLGYGKNWQNFERPLEKAMKSCEAAGHTIGNHFNASIKKVPLGSGAERDLDDYSLTRLACYLIAQNGNPRKKEIAEAQLYFAVQTRRQELSDEQAKLSENKRRIRYREDVKHRNSGLQDAARDAGVISRLASTGLMRQHRKATGSPAFEK